MRATGVAVLAFLAALNALGAGRVSAAAVTAAGAAAPDKVYVGASVQAGTILGVAEGKLRLRGERGVLEIGLNTVRAVEKAAPPELAAAMQAFAAGKNDEALPMVSKVADTFKGLPVPWVGEALSLQGDVLVAVGKYDDAEKAYGDLQKFYPSADGSLPPRAQVGLAQVAVERQNVEEARKLLEPMSETALNELNALPEQGKIYGQVFYLLGRLDEAEGKEGQALENYLRTVTIFHQDPIATARAKERADTLGGKVTVP